jgi:hypothetical protein
MPNTAAMIHTPVKVAPPPLPEVEALSYEKIMHSHQ